MAGKNTSGKKTDHKKEEEKIPLHRDASTGRFTKKIQDSAHSCKHNTVPRKGTDGTGPGGQNQHK